ncbi:hypothetical protein MEQ_05140 [Candida albicans P87]|nr:hypothetical protein MEQ_05140 [Candida albicans P87]
MSSDNSLMESESSFISTPQKSQKRQSFGSSGCDLRPLRLTKQRNRNSIISNSSNSPSGTPTTPSFDSPSRKGSLPTNEEFHCRPIRLGRNASTHSEDRHNSISSIKKLTSDNNINSKSSEIKKSIDEELSTTDSHSSHSSKRQSFDSQRRKSDSSNSSKRKSIQIKNLPITSTTTRNSSKRASQSQYDDMIFAICLVDFHHQRGPEIQWWKSNYHPDYKQGLFKNIPFQALPDGSHLFEETFSNFNLVYDFDQKQSIDDFNDVNNFKGDPRHLKTLFGCSCVRQVKTSDLTEEERERNKDITRSIVQKAIVVITRKQPIFTKIKDKLSIIAKSYFQQETFDNFEILDNLFENLNGQFKLVDNEMHTELEQEEENYVNLNLKSTVAKFRSRFLIIFKSLLLEKKVLIYSNNNLEALTQFQNNMLSLMPNLINNLDDSGCPLIDYAETNGPLSKPQSLNTTNRVSMLRFFGLPLQIFNTKNSFWNPYLPLQQLDELAVNSFMIGCSNLLFVNQATSYGIDVLINLDTNEVTYPKNLYATEDLQLSALDKKFIHHLVNCDQTTTKHDDFIGSDDYIRYKFEDYLNSLISTMRYNQYSERFGQPPPGFNEASHITEFNMKFIESWKKTQNFKIWNMMADEFIFNFIEPKHTALDLKDEPYSINKNISNFFNSFKAKTTAITNTSSMNDQTIKAHKFIEDDDQDEDKDEDKDKEEEEEDDDDDEYNNENEDTVDELVAGFEKVVPLTEDKSMGTPSSPIIPPTPKTPKSITPTTSKSTTPTTTASTETIGKRLSTWTIGWGFGKK